MFASGLTGGSDRQQRNAAYLRHALAAGRYPRLAGLLAPAAADPGTGPGPAGRYRDIMARILTGLLAPQPPA